MKGTKKNDQENRTSKDNHAFDFEAWKETELERIKKIHADENQVILEKIDKEWKTSLSQANKSWNSHEDRLLKDLISAGKLADEFNSESQKNRQLKDEITQLEKELANLRKPREDTEREERISRISSLRYEINQLDGKLREIEEDLQNTTREKNKYKKLCQQAFETLKQKVAKI
ncbi:coiled-coiled tumor supressor gene, putative [Trichomonas vaginalis G3]|uniref:Coiled-coiled tumor supressor gene, putative n=1 Tax=Trichomonas vaginalis (strain ATCC PRA-98 / G3) TaxID=412133 RepID=A2F399_TRIV3|nr:hypothetical protein TVAGG3_1027820 [Trichomonas vaginalis G3]EAY00608.1 coiled-coiled tumor supressor gene, putative [Trichomonas vaginalis G3]KAI5492633.1 hypothetical protein TVAGG3_1027820 [Trichomonas vaginalis G3]|eukprot:XP_001313537.1 coiled-coiled tumor supressor gene [Trichomonas vaginalis G3]